MGDDKKKPGTTSGRKLADGAWVTYRKDDFGKPVVVAPFADEVTAMRSIFDEPETGASGFVFVPWGMKVEAAVDLKEVGHTPPAPPAGRKVADAPQA